VRVEEHTAEIDGQPLFWRAAPVDGPPPLYIHGVPTSSDDWLPLLERTGGLAPDLPGFGRSGKGGHLDYSIGGIAAFVERFLGVVGVERVQLVVHDWGAAALAFAVAHPERIERLIVCNALPLLPGYRWHRVARLWRTPVVGELTMGATTRWGLARGLRPAFAGPVPEAFVDDTWSHFDQGTQRAILRLYRGAPEERLAEAGAELSHIRVPSLVVCGTHDPYIGCEFADAYAARLPGGRVVRVDDAGHWPWLDRAGPEVIETFATFLGES
jgi:pimeloyl-ACP methyl ester carboxylesterase